VPGSALRSISGPPMNRFACPTCKSVLEVSDHWSGNEVTCSTCGQQLLFRNPSRQRCKNHQPHRHKRVRSQPRQSSFLARQCQATEGLFPIDNPARPSGSSARRANLSWHPSAVTRVPRSRARRAASDLKSPTSCHRLRRLSNHPNQKREAEWQSSSWLVRMDTRRKCPPAGAAWSMSSRTGPPGTAASATGAEESG